MCQMPTLVDAAANFRFEPFLTFQTTESMAALCQKRTFVKLTHYRNFCPQAGKIDRKVKMVEGVCPDGEKFGQIVFQLSADFQYRAVGWLWK